MMIKELLMVGLCRLQTRMLLLGKRKFLQHGVDLHVGIGKSLLAAKSLLIGNSAYIGKHVHIEANCVIVGNSSNNSNVGTYLDERLPFGNRWKKMLSRKGLPVKSWLQLTRRHGGFIWPLYFSWPYIRLVCQSAFSLICKQKL